MKVHYDQEFLRIVNRLSEAAEEGYYDPYTTFDWPDSLDLERTDMWVSPELSTIHGTEYEQILSLEQRALLSKWESINFYSLNVHGIRELLIEVAKRVHRPGFREADEFFHHFIGEENNHMWFFSRFCELYGGKTYPELAAPATRLDWSMEAETFIIFSRILIFEQIVDYYNSIMGRDPRLHKTIQSINYIHHQDESRHIAFGAQMVRILHAMLKHEHPEELDMVNNYLIRYVDRSIASLYNPQVYRDAQIVDPLAFRQSLLNHPVRRTEHRKILSRTLDTFRRHADLEGEGEYW